MLSHPRAGWRPLPVAVERLRLHRTLCAVRLHCRAARGRLLRARVRPRRLPLLCGHCAAAACRRLCRIRRAPAASRATRRTNPSATSTTAAAAMPRSTSRTPRAAWPSSRPMRWSRRRCAAYQHAARGARVWLLSAHRLPSLPAAGSCGAVPRCLAAARGQQTANLADVSTLAKLASRRSVRDVLPARWRAAYDKIMRRAVHAWCGPDALCYLCVRGHAGGLPLFSGRSPCPCAAARASRKKRGTSLRARRHFDQRLPPLRNTACSSLSQRGSSAHTLHLALTRQPLGLPRYPSCTRRRLSPRPRPSSRA